MDIDTLKKLAGINEFQGYTEYKIDENPSITATALKQKERDIEYYENYKKSLCQFIITNSCYVANGKYHGRVHLKHADMLNLLKEIQRLEILIYEIKNGKQVQKTTTKRTAKFI